MHLHLGRRRRFRRDPRHEMGPLREAEQRAAAKEVGVSDVGTSATPMAASPPPRPAPRHQPGDPPLPPAAGADPVARDLVAPPAASHPDHRAAGEAALAAVYPDARNPFAHPELLADEGLEAWSVGELWLMAAPDERIDHVVDITDTVGRKVAALQAHASQTTHMTISTNESQPGGYVGSPLRTDRRALRRGVPDVVID